MADKLVRGNSMDGAIRVFAAVTTDLVNEAQRIHHTYPVKLQTLLPLRIVTVGSEVTFQTRMLTDRLTIKVNLMSAVLSAADI